MPTRRLRNRCSAMLKKGDEQRLKEAILAADAAVSSAEFRIAPDHNGERTLFARIVLNDHDIRYRGEASRELGKRLQKLATALLDAAAHLEMFTSVEFLSESEAPRRRHAKQHKILHKIT